MEKGEQIHDNKLEPLIGDVVAGKRSWDASTVDKVFNDKELVVLLTFLQLKPATGTKLARMSQLLEHYKCMVGCDDSAEHYES